MCEIIVKAIDATHPDPVKDQRGCYKRGYPVAVYPDGTKWGKEERLPKFVIIKFPGVPVDNAIVQKYIQPELGDTPDINGIYPVVRRRLWKIRFDDLPLIARNKLATNGELTIKVGTYAGTYDYTWTQVKNFFRNQKTGLDETAEI
jgi:hypothetical protein